MGGDAEEEKVDMAVVGRGGKRANRKREQPSAQKELNTSEGKKSSGQPTAAATLFTRKCSSHPIQFPQGHSCGIQA